MLKTEQFTTFKQRIAQWFKISERDFRLWVLVNRQNKTIRPDVPIHDSEANQSELRGILTTDESSYHLAMDYIRNNMAARAADLRLYLDYNPDHAKFNGVSATNPSDCFPSSAASYDLMLRVGAQS